INICLLCDLANSKAIHLFSSGINLHPVPRYGVKSEPSRFELKVLIVSQISERGPVSRIPFDNCLGASWSENLHARLAKFRALPRVLASDSSRRRSFKGPAIAPFLSDLQPFLPSLPIVE